MKNNEKYKIAREMTKLKLHIDVLSEYLETKPLRERLTVATRINNNAKRLDTYFTMLDIIGCYAFWDDASKSFIVEEIKEGV